MPYINMHCHEANLPYSVQSIACGQGQIPKKGWFSAGLHPWYAPDEAAWAQFEAAIQLPNCVAIGECGLDGLRQSELYTEATFIKQIETAKLHEKPIIIHTVRTIDRCLAILKEHNAAQIAIFHGANWRLSLMEQIAESGAYFSMGHALMQEESAATVALENGVVALDKLFFETDVKTDVEIESIYACAADYLDLGLETLKQQVLSNFNTLTMNRYAG